ncbi:MAG TPA: DNA polymerase III subunit gamma/tau [Verrucomicrobiae bacterium]|jgi:DNA polymerase-3 subunit gamma/tau|nr:DNA polymerase III subunit gamma/tau [Verrucomicrobiae bacterium]
MSYLVLARKWRPQRFEDMVGQGHVTQVLRNAIAGGRIAHAYLFTGVRGVGKTTAARILAKALNCERGPTADPCNQCSQCVEITDGRSLDVYEIDGASNRGIDEVRQIIENVRYQPARSRFKIYIIDEVHQVTKDAFNALLKTLEEPPEFVKFILATTEPHRLPETILSRCQRFDFRRIQTREVVDRLKDIAGKESLSITDGALLLLAREAEGSMRDAQSLLEQMLSYAAPGSGQRIDERLVENILGVTERRVLYDVSGAILRGDAKTPIEIIARVVDQGKDVVRLSRELVEHFRNLFVARLMQEAEGRLGSAAAATREQLLDLPEQEMEDLRAQASASSADALLDYFKFMAEGDEEVARSAYPRFALEAALVRLATLPAALPVGQLIDRLEALEKKLSSGGDARPTAQPASHRVESVFRAVTEKPQTPAASPANAAAIGAKRELPSDAAAQWQQFLAFVTQQKKFLATHLADVEPLALPPGPLNLAVAGRHHFTYLQDPENLSSLKEFARSFFSTDVSVSLSLTEEKRPRGETDKDPAAGADLTDMVREAHKIFGGSVKPVKRAD